MRLLIRAILYLAALCVIALIGFAVFSDLAPPQREIAIPIEPR